MAFANDRFANIEWLAIWSDVIQISWTTLKVVPLNSLAAFGLMQNHQKASERGEVDTNALAHVLDSFRLIKKAFLHIKNALVSLIGAVVKFFHFSFLSGNPCKV